MPDSTPLALIGLGNPGVNYARNRHNIGFMMVATLAHQAAASAPQQKFSGLLQQADIGGRRVYFFYPQTFMNRSGIPAAQLLNFYKIPPENVIVFHDELDLPLAKIRVKQGGGHGGHNGLKSLDAHIGQNYWRVRMGIGHPGNKDMVSSYVLSDFSPPEQKEMGVLIEGLTNALDYIIKMDMPGLTNKLALSAVH